MSDGSTTPPEPESDGADAVVPPVLPDGIVPPPPVFDRDRADAVVPPPPAFESPLTGSLPPVGSAPSIASEGEVVPPPPAFGSATGALRRRPATDAAGSAVASEEEDAPAFDQDPVFAAPETPSSGNYRGLTAGIFVFLALLFAGAIALGICLATNTTLEWPSFDDASTSESTSAPDAEASAGSIDVNTLISEPCSDFCADVARAMGSAADPTLAAGWVLVQPWTTSDDAGASDLADVATSSYGSSAGAIEMTVHGYADDALAAQGFYTLSAELGAPTASGQVYEDGTGTLNKYQGEESTTYIWVVPGDAGNPWVVTVQGDDADDVHAFYMALPI